MAARRVVTALVSTAAVLATACSPAPTPTAGPASTPVSAQPAPAAGAPAARATKWTALQTGDCLQGLPPTDPAVVTVALVDCATPHRAEVFQRAGIPVNTALTDTAATECETGFVQYTGTSPAGSPYTIVYLIDSEQDRTDNNPYPSSVICLLQGAQGQWLTGSARR